MAAWKMSDGQRLTATRAPEDATEFHALLGHLQASWHRLPPLYRDAVYEPDVQALRGLDRRARRRMQEISRLTPAQRPGQQRRKYRDLLAVTTAVLTHARATGHRTRGAQLPDPLAAATVVQLDLLCRDQPCEEPGFVYAGETKDDFAHVTATGLPWSAGAGGATIVPVA